MWRRVREFGYGLGLVWIATLSVAFGAILFFAAPQAQDLFLEVRGSPGQGLAFWAMFYVVVLAIWVLPVYVSARWLLWHLRYEPSSVQDMRPVADWARRSIPGLLAVGCMLALLLGQALALLNVPDLVDLSRIEDNIVGHRAAIDRQCGASAAGCVLAYIRFFSDGALWILRSEWGLGTEWMIFLLYVFACGLGLWHVLGHRTLLIDHGAARFWLRAVWWLVTLATLPAVVFLVLVFSGYLWAEARNPHTVAHLALLPAISIAIAYALWELLKPRHPHAAPALAALLLGRPRSGVDEDRAFQILVDPLFKLLVGFAILATLVLLVLDPIDVTAVVSRAQIVPFLLGPLVPLLTALSYWSARLKAPLVVGLVMVVGIANSVVADRHTVRTLAGGATTERQSLDQSAAHWAKINGCDLARPELCPSPIVIAAAGGASRAGFLVGSLIGKLTDERTTLAALGPSLGQPARPLRPFENQLFAIAGVSGGSLGAVMSYAALADRRMPPDWPAAGSIAGAPAIAPPCRSDATSAHHEWYGSSPTDRPPLPPYESWQSCLGLLLAGDFLSPVFVKLMGSDLIGLGMSTDRAVTLEQAWERRYREITGSDTLARSLTAVRAQALERGLWLPILLLNGTSVEAGRRIVTSDVDMTARGAPTRAEPRGARLASTFVDAHDLHAMLAPAGPPQATRSRTSRDLALSTAATMSARFPLISPHGSITSADGTILDRVVDGGYYENFGASTALELVRLLKSRYGLTPTVIVVNNEPTTEPMDCVTDESQVSQPTKPPQRFWFSTINSPLDAVNKTRSARGSHAAVELCSYVRSPQVGGSFAFVTVKKSGHKPLSMSWWLSKHVQQYLALHLASNTAAEVDSSNRDQEFARVNQKAFQEITRRRLAQ